MRLAGLLGDLEWHTEARPENKKLKQGDGHIQKDGDSGLSC